MEILPLQENMIRHLTNVYNEAVAPIPHCYPANSYDMLAQVSPALSGEANEPRHDEAVFVAVDQRKMIGFAHAAIGPKKPGRDPDAGLIRFLWYRPGNREAGSALLKAAEAHCAALGYKEMHAFPQKHRYPFYLFSSAYMSDRFGHVAALFGLNGYQRCDGEVYMDWIECSVEKPGPLPDRLPVSVEHTAGLGRMPGVTVRVQPEGKQIGICENVSAGEFSRDRLAQDWIFTEWLAVDEEYRGLGLGRWLMQRALWEALQIGYRHAAISTAWDNYRALLFYTNFGYQVRNWTYGYRRELA
jgi:GNAT superfamily N-acetyltransferase